MKKSWMTFILLAGMLCVPNAEAQARPLVLPNDSNIYAVIVCVEAEITFGSKHLYTDQITQNDQPVILKSIPFPSSLTQFTEIYNFTCTESVPLYGDSIHVSAMTAGRFVKANSLPVAMSPELTFKGVYAPVHSCRGSNITNINHVTRKANNGGL